jgi:hypothetical protein
MPELNPYEPPQSEVQAGSSAKLRESASWFLSSRLIVPSLLGLQVVVGVLSYAFDYLQTILHSGYHQRLQKLTDLFTFSCFVLGIVLLLIGSSLGCKKLVVFEILVLGIILWCTRPIMY